MSVGIAAAIALATVTLASSRIAWIALLRIVLRVTLLLMLLVTPREALGEEAPGMLEIASSRVAFLHTPEPSNPKKVKIGTGFFIATANNGGRTFLVTAKHVAATLDQSSRVTVQADGDRPFTVPLTEMIGSSFIEAAFTSHATADVTVIELGYRKPEIAKQMQGHYLPPAVLERAKAAPGRSVTLTVVGFPLALGVEADAFSPISRDTRPASGLINRPCPSEGTCTFFVTQDPSVGGFSGAPLFDFGHPEFRPGGGITVRAPRGMRIVGLASGTLQDDTGGKLGLIVPSTYIVETLEKAGVVLPTPVPPPTAAELETPAAEP